MEMFDPFKTDTNKYKEMLNQDSQPKNQPQYAEYEDVTNAEDLLNKNTFTLPPNTFRAVQDAQNRLAQDKEKRDQVANMFNNLFSELNQKYGLNVQFDFDSFSNSIQYIIQPQNKRAMEMYLSEAYGRFRVVLYQRYLQAIALLSSQILDPAYILSDSMTYADKLEIMKQLYEFMKTMNEIYEQVNIPDTELKLEKISEDNHSQSYDINDPRASEFLGNLFKNVSEQQKSDDESNMNK